MTFLRFPTPAWRIPALKARALPVVVSAAVLGSGAAIAVGLGAAGTAAADAMGLAMPGAIFGLAVLASLIRIVPKAAAGTGALFDRVAPHMVLFFIPAGSGVVSRAAQFADSWPVVVAAVGPGTLLIMAMVAVMGGRAFGRDPGKGQAR